MVSIYDWLIQNILSYKKNYSFCNIDLLLKLVIKNEKIDKNYYICILLF